MLRFILGRAGSGKTHACLSECLRAAADPAGGPLVLLGPEQATYQLERALLDRTGPGAVSRIQVLSFGRLGYRVLEETGGLGQERIDSVGRQMVLRVVLGHLAGKLRVFGTAATEPGFAAALARQITEFEAYDQSPQGLTAAAERVGGTSGDRLHDVARCWEAYQRHLADLDILDPGSDLALAADAVARTPLGAATYWIDGFAGFTPREERMLRALLQAGATLNVALCLDPDEPPTDLDGPGPWPLPEADHPFAPTRETLFRLLQLRRLTGAMWGGVRCLHRPWRFAGRPDLERLEAWLPAPEGAPPRPDGPSAVHIRGAVDPQDEAMAIAGEIARLCREEGFRYRETAVILHDLEGYADALEAAFTAFGIPHFIDRRRSAVHHPLVRSLQAAMGVITAGWSTEAVRRYLRTDLCGLNRTRADELDNIALERALWGPEWHGEECPKLRGDRRLDGIRRRASRPVRALEESLSPQGETASGAAVAEALYAFLVAVGAERAVARWTEEAAEAGRMEEASWHRQVWAAVIGTLDQMALGCANEPLEPEMVASLLETALADRTVGLVPPGLDQVLCGSVERSRHPELRAVFVPGMAEGAFPPTPIEGILLGDRDRQLLADGGLAMAPGSSERLLRSRYLSYIALTRSAERLYLSWPSGAEPAEALRQVQGLLPQAPSWGSEGLPTSARGLRALAAELALAPRPLPPEWAAAARFLEQEAPEVAGSLAPPDRPALRPPLAHALWGLRPLPATALETMGACPFRHFASAGLRLQARPEGGIGPSEIGQFAHDILASITKTVIEMDIDWGNLADADLQGLVTEAAETAIKRMSVALESGGPRAAYFLSDAISDVVRAASAVRNHFQAGSYRPTAAEAAFGEPETWPALQAGTATVRGRIDRVDRAVDTQGRTHLRIIDYKTGRQKFNLIEVPEGTDLQPVLYLLAAMAAEPGSLPGGFFLLPTAHNWQTVSAPPRDADVPLPELQGFAPAEKESLALHEQALDGSVTGVRLRKDGQPYAQDPALSVRGFDNLRVMIDHVVKALDRRVAAGEIQPYPFRGKQLVCTTCPYIAVCRFDPAGGDRYRRPIGITPKQLKADLERGPEDGRQAVDGGAS